MLSTRQILRWLLFAPLTVSAQVGIGTTTLHNSSILELSATYKGILSTRFTLTGTSDVLTISSPATGLLVFNTATAGNSPNNVTLGFHYYHETKWKRIISQQPDATVSFNSPHPCTGAPVLTPNTTQSADQIHVSRVDASQWTWKR